MSSASLAQAISSGADEVYCCNLTVGAAQTIAKNIGYGFRVLKIFSFK
jgi:hypothetical protein